MYRVVVILLPQSLQPSAIYMGSFVLLCFRDDAACVVFSALWSPQQALPSYSENLHR